MRSDSPSGHDESAATRRGGIWDRLGRCIGCLVLFGLVAHTCSTVAQHSTGQSSDIPHLFRFPRWIALIQHETVVLDVRGLIYHGDFHFTSCIVGTDGTVWYHDGMTTGSSCENEGDFDKFSSKKLLKCKRKN